MVSMGQTGNECQNEEMSDNRSTVYTKSPVKMKLRMNRREMSDKMKKSVAKQCFNIIHWIC